MYFHLRICQVSSVYLNLCTILIFSLNNIKYQKLQTVSVTSVRHIQTGDKYINSKSQLILSMSRRNLERINYKLLNSTGRITPLVQEESTEGLIILDEDLSFQLSNMTLSDDLEIDVKVLLEEINDTIEENKFTFISTTEIDAVIQKLEHQRNQLRHKSLKLGTTELPIKQVIQNIKDYIIAAKDFKSKTRLQEEVAKNEQRKYNERSAAFSIVNIDRQMNELFDVFNEDPTNASNDELIQWRKNYPIHEKKFEKVAASYQDVLKTPITDADRLVEIKDISANFHKLSKLKQTFARILNEEIKHREPEKLSTFNKLSLNIKLEKFSGYNSKTDFYSFKSDFEKIHLQSTPKRLLPDLLKNNFLGDPALTMVKSLDDLDVIWKRLESAFGDAKIMLSKKLQQLSNLDDVKRTNNSEKLTAGLAKIINMLHDISKLAKDHNVEEYLYYGDTLAKVYNLLGDRRTTKFITSICDDNLSPKQTWFKLISFLEREQKIHQQKTILSLKTDVPPKDRNNKPSNQHKSESYNNSPYPTVCQICESPDGSNDHVSTAGPAGTRLLQYFTCKNFVKSTPALRLKMLRENNFCIQCLYPGANASSPKHAEGRCQRDFICPHPAHSKYPVKKTLPCVRRPQDQQ